METGLTTLCERLLRAMRKRVDSRMIAVMLTAELKHETRKQRELALKVFEEAMRMNCTHELVLEAMGKENILPSDMGEQNALACALRSHRKDAVMAVVQRYRKEEPYELSISTLRAFFDWQFFGEDEKATAEVLSVIPRATWRVVPDQGLDALDQAIGPSWRPWWREAVETVLRLGPSMEERLKGQKRFRYVMSAIDCGHLETVRAMHDMVPLLPDGSGRRGTGADYSSAIEKLMLPDHSEFEAIFDYLMEQGGPDAVDEVSPGTLLIVEGKEEADRLLGCAPHLLEELCKEKNILERLALNEGYALLSHLMALMVEMVDREVIAKMLRQEVIFSNELDWEIKRDYGWRLDLEPLHKGAPECMDGLRWQWLMDSVKGKCYPDVEYMLGMCTQEHLVMRDESGDTAYDVAARDKKMPPKLLARLQKQAKKALA